MDPVHYTVAAAIISGAAIIITALIKYIPGKGMSKNLIPGFAKRCEEHTDEINRVKIDLAVSSEKQDTMLKKIENVENNVAKLDKKFDSLDSWVRKNR